MGSEDARSSSAWKLGYLIDVARVVQNIGSV